MKENIKAPRHWPLCGEFTGTGEFPAQRASYAENVSIWWRHHVSPNNYAQCVCFVVFCSVREPTVFAHTPWRGHYEETLSALLAICDGNPPVAWSSLTKVVMQRFHDDVIKWKQFPRNWAFVRGIHRPPVNSPHKGQWRGTFMFSLICAWINGWANNRDAGDLRRHRAHYGVTVIDVFLLLSLVSC